MQTKLKADNKSTWNSVIVESNKSNNNYNQSKRVDMSFIQKKFTVKNKKESDSLLVYNDDYKDHLPKNQFKFKKNKSGGRRSGKDTKIEGRMSSRKPFKTISTYKQSHKRSQSLNKSTIEQRYRSVPQSGHQYENENARKSYTKKKLNWLFNNRTPQIHMSKSKYADAKLDFNIKNAKKNLKHWFKDQYNYSTAYQKNFESLTGREKGNALLRKVYLRMDHENPANVSFRNTVIQLYLNKIIGK